MTGAKVPESFDGGATQWARGVVHDGVIYCIPSRASAILMYNIASQQMTTKDFPAIIGSSSGAQWSGGIVHESILYGIPYNSDHLLIFDTVSKQVSSKKVPSNFDAGE